MDLERGNRKQLKLILKKYREGKATEGEIKAVDAWYESFESETDEITPAANKDHIYQELLQGIEKRLWGTKNRTGNIRRLTYRVSVAAAVLLFAAIGALYITGRKAKEPEVQIVSTLNSAHKMVTLPDGSVVELNGHSRLVIANDFNKHDRKIALEGEAFFDIAHNAHKPFVVTSGVLETVVKGTSFDIRAYHDLGHIKISVFTGIVKVSKQQPAHAGQVLTQGIIKDQTLTYNLKTGKGDIKNESTPEIASWRHHNVFIDNFTMPEIASLLRRHFSTKVLIEPDVNLNEHFTIDMANPSLAHALNTLSVLTKHNFLIGNNQIIIKNKMKM
jgi:transmembrane sensor